MIFFTNNGLAIIIQFLFIILYLLNDNLVNSELKIMPSKNL